MTKEVDTSKEAVERVAAYLQERKIRKANGHIFSAEHIHSFVMKEGWLHLTVSDLRALLAERDQLRREVEEARELMEWGSSVFRADVAEISDLENTLSSYNEAWQGAQIAADQFDAFLSKPRP